jgi:hypothetical protein
LVDRGVLKGFAAPLRYNLDISDMARESITFLTSTGRVPWPPPTYSKQEK